MKKLAKLVAALLACALFCASAFAEGARVGEEPVQFRDPEFGRMLREAMGKPVGGEVYPSELEAVIHLNIRMGHLTFDENVQMPVAGYEQGNVLDLSDLALFPKLRSLSVTDMECTGYEVLAGLDELRRLTLIDTGVTDCGFAADLSLELLNLARNGIVDFAGLEGMTGLKSLNLYATGLNSLDVLRGLVDLEVLFIGGNPISDLKPLYKHAQLCAIILWDTCNIVEVSA